MFVGDRANVLRMLGLVGAMRCGYTRPVSNVDEQVQLWLQVRCDCKYGLPGLLDEAMDPATQRGEVLRRRTPEPSLHKLANSMYGGEQNGCPELRSLYTVVAAMTDAEWDQLSARRRNMRVRGG